MNVPLFTILRLSYRKNPSGKVSVTDLNPIDRRSYRPINYLKPGIEVYCTSISGGNIRFTDRHQSENPCNDYVPIIMKTGECTQITNVDSK